MGQVTSKGNEAKSKMKLPTDMPTPRFELEWEWYVVQHAQLDRGGTPKIGPSDYRFKII